MFWDINLDLFHQKYQMQMVQQEQNYGNELIRWIQIVGTLGH